MDGLRELVKANETPQTDGVKYAKRQALAWMRRAENALGCGNYEQFRNQLAQAAKETEHLK